MSVSSPVTLLDASVAEGRRESLFAALARAVWGAAVGLWRSPRYSVPAVLSLALGVGASTAVFAVFSALMLRPLPFPEEERLVRVGFPGASAVLESGELSLSAPLLREFQQLTSVFENVATERSWGGRLEIDGRMSRVGPQLTSLSFFDTLGVEALEGRLFTARGPAPDGLDVLVIREGYWRQQLGGAPIVGQIVRYEERPMKVLGILRDEQAIPSYMDVWLPENQAVQTRRTQFIGRGIARLAPGVSLESAQARLTEVSESTGVRAADGAPLTARLMPLRDSLVQPQRAWLGLMMAAVAAFLLLAAANLAALFATRASSRSHEWSVRRALGSSAWRLGRHSALDAGLVGVLGAGLGLVLANVAVKLTNEEYHDFLGNTPARLDGRVLIACALATSLCALAGALAPVLSLRRVQPADALRGEGRATDTARARRLREGLLVVQVAVTTLLMLDAGLLVRSVRSLLAINPGFHTHDVVTANVLVPLEPPRPGLDPEQREQAFHKRAEHMFAMARAGLDGLRRMPGVVSASVSVDVPFDWHSWPARYELPPNAPQKEVMAFVHFVGPGYFQTLGVPLLSGRAFGNELTMEYRPIAVVSRSLARALGVPDAVGQSIHQLLPTPAADIPWTEIVGMVEDTLENDLTGPAPYQVYLPYSQGVLSVSGPTSAGFILAARSDDPARLMRELPSALGTAMPGTASQPIWGMDQWVEKSFWQRTALSRVLSALALAAIALSAIGLFGVTSFAVTQRVGELAIRRALGATRAGVIGLVLGETLGVVAIGVIIGAALSWLGQRLLAAFLFGVGLLDPMTYGAVCLGVALVAIVAALSPALAASRVNPARALA